MNPLVFQCSKAPAMQKAVSEKRSGAATDKSGLHEQVKSQLDAHPEPASNGSSQPACAIRHLRHSLVGCSIGRDN